MPFQLHDEIKSPAGFVCFFPPDYLLSSFVSCANLSFCTSHDFQSKYLIKDPGVWQTTEHPLCPAHSLLLEDSGLFNEIKQLKIQELSLLLIFKKIFLAVKA